MLGMNEMKAKLAELEETRENIIGNLNFITGQVTLLKEMIDPPKPAQSDQEKNGAFDEVPKKTLTPA